MTLEEIKVSKDTGIGCIGTIAIIALIVIGFVFFREKLLATSAVIVILAAPFLPLYYVYRKNQEEQRTVVKYGVEKLVAQSVESLEELEELVEGSIEGLKEFGKYIKDYEKREKEEELKSYKEEIKGCERAEELLASYKNELKGQVGLAWEYGSEIRYLYAVLKKIQSITYSLRGI